MAGLGPQGHPGVGLRTHARACAPTPRAASPLRPAGRTSVGAHCRAGRQPQALQALRSRLDAQHPAALEPRLRHHRLSFHRQPQDPSAQAFPAPPCRHLLESGQQPWASPMPLPCGGRPAEGSLASGPATLSFPPCPRPTAPSSPRKPPGLFELTVGLRRLLLVSFWAEHWK